MKISYDDFMQKLLDVHLYGATELTLCQDSFDDLIRETPSAMRVVDEEGHLRMGGMRIKRSKDV